MNVFSNVSLFLDSSVMRMWICVCHHNWKKIHLRLPIRIAVCSRKSLSTSPHRLRPRKIGMKSKSGKRLRRLLPNWIWSGLSLLKPQKAMRKIVSEDRSSSANHQVSNSLLLVNLMWIFT